MTSIVGGKAPTTENKNPSLSSDPRSARRAVWAALVGSSLESFDFYVFAYFSAFFSATVFFPESGSLNRQLLAFSTIAVSFVVRPIGAAIFGNIGDRIGRRRTLILTITVMGVSTGLIGLLPSYSSIGIAAPLLLVLLRVIQGLSLGGEWGGGILLAVENASPRRRGLYAALPQLGSPIGTALVAILFTIGPRVFGDEAMVEWAWRIPFLLAFPLLLVSLWLRLTIDETPVFREIVKDDKRVRVPILDTLRRHPVAVVVAIASAVLGIGSYSLMNTYTLNYGVMTLGFDYSQLALATLIGSALQLVTIPLFGAWADRIGPARVVAIGAAGTLIIAFPMYLLLTQATFSVLVATMIVGGILPTLAWAGLGGLMANLFGGPIRYSALSIAYAVAATISGFVPLVTGALGVATDEAWWHPGIVLVVLSAITLAGAIVAARWPKPVSDISA